MESRPQHPASAALLEALSRLTDAPVLGIRLDQAVEADATPQQWLDRLLREGRVAFVSDAALEWLGTTKDAALDHPVHELFGTQADGRRADPLRELFESEGEVQVVREEGGATLVLLLVGSAAQRARAERLQTAGMLITGIAHDYHNLLTVMLGSAELAMQQAKSGDPTPHLEEIHAAARSASSLGQQLAALSYEREPELQAVDLMLLASRSVGMLRRLLDPSTQLTLEVAGDTPRVTADPRQLEQALIGMVLAVRSALPVDARLVVQAAEDDVLPLVRLRVVGHHPTSHAVEPSGPGLALARSVIELAGGRLELETVADGTAIRAWLPPAYGGPRSLGEARAEQAGEGAGELVLLVDDHDVLRNYVARLLRSNGYEVHAVRNADEALDLPASDRAAVSVIVTDVLMPGMSGPEFLSRWREENPDTPALFTSGAAGSRTELERWLGSDWVLIEKPFRNDDLLSALRTLRRG